MNIYVKIEEGLVTESWRYPEGVIAPAEFTSVTQDHLVGWTYDGTTFYPPVQSLDELRLERDALLKGSDWTQLPDISLSIELKSDWVVYRQDLRDLTIGYVPSANPAFPIPPDHIPE